MQEYKKLEDLYEDIQGAALDTLERNLTKYNLPINQAIAYYMNETEGIFELNEMERVVTYIALGIFIAKYDYRDEKIINNILSSITMLESNEYDDLLNEGDKNLIDRDIKIIKEYLNQ